MLVAYSLGAGGGGLTDGCRVEYVLRFPQIRRSIHPSSLQGLFPNLGAVKPAYSGNLGFKGDLGVSYPRIVTLILGRFLGSLSLVSGKLSLPLGPHGFVPGILRHTFVILCQDQSFILIIDLLLGYSQLILGF